MKLIPTKVDGWPEMVMLPESIRVTKPNSQKRKLAGKWRGGIFVVPTVRWDDECGNGHNTFAVTATLYEKDARSRTLRDVGGGCCHDEIEKSHPELKHLIRWHLCNSDGPWGYLGNTIYHAGARDCWGLLKGERRQLVNGRTGKPSWILEADASLEKYVDADTRPEQTATLRYVPWERIGEGKERQLDAARSSAVWPEATDEELMQEPEVLKPILIARLPALMQQMYQDITNFGFVY